MKKLFFIIMLLCGFASARTYGPYAFPGTQNPLSDSGQWNQQGLTTGLDWANINTSGGRAIGTQAGTESCPSNCNDSTALVGGPWGADQTCQITVSVTTAPTSGTVFQEAECRVRSTITAHSNTGYELNCSVSTNASNNYMQIVRWNGALGAFTQIQSTGTHHCVNGDVVKLTIVGSTLTAFLNGVQIMTVSDSTFTTGSPGIGLFTTGGSGLNGNFGISSATLSDTVAAQWDEILDDSRAIDWSVTQPGVTGGAIGAIPSGSWTQCGPTITAYGTSGSYASPATINNALAHSSAGYTGCGINTYVLLGAGSFFLTPQINIPSSNNELRGSGSNSTFLHFNNPSTVNCGGPPADICMMGMNLYYGGSQVVSGGTNSATWTAGYAPGTTSLTFTNVGSTGLHNGQYIILDQYNDTTCVSVPNGLIIADNPVSATGCSLEAGSPGRNSASSWSPTRNLQQIVKIVSGCASACTGSGPFTIVITPGVYSNKWASGKSPGAWWADTQMNFIGVQNLSTQHDVVCSNTPCFNFMFYNSFNGWVANVRSVFSGRDHVYSTQTAHITVRDNYFFGAQNLASQSYGTEQFISSDNLVENNIAQQVTTPVQSGPSQGTVIAYNYSINNLYEPSGCGPPCLGMQPSNNGRHDAAALFTLTEGNIGAGYLEDVFHGTGGLNTVFRNRFTGWENTKTGQTTPIQLFSFNRFTNVVGNVLGEVGYHTTYQTSLGAGSSKGIYDLNSGNTEGPSLTVLSDSYVATSMLRWGNWDNVSNANRFVSSEIPTALTDGFSNSVPVTQTMPGSFFRSAKPFWWPSGKAWPIIGPDITGGNVGQCSAGTYAGSPCTSTSQCTGGSCTVVAGGEAISNPAMDCYLNTMAGPPDGGGLTLGSPLAYNSTSCYTAGPPTVNTPTFSPVAGTYGSTQSVTINTTTSGATLCYTIDGSTPTANGAGTCTHGTTYSTAVSVASSLTIKAIGTLSGDSDSAVGSAAYVITPPTVATPTFSPVAGSYGSTQLVTISTATGGATICYTTNGSTPTADGAGTCTSGTTYTVPVSVPSSLTLKAIGSISGGTDSAVGSAAYVITPPAATPTFSPVAGTYAGSQSVTISSTTSGATICYTTNGSTPTANGSGTCTSGTTYVGTVSVTSNLTLKAVASKSGNTDSTVGSAVYAITYLVNTTVVGGGMVTDNTAAISCPGTCSATYSSGTSVTLTATPNAGNSFTGWSGTGGCTGTSTCVVSMTTNRNATATFAVIPAIHNGTVGTGARVSGGAVIR